VQDLKQIKRTVRGGHMENDVMSWERSAFTAQLIRLQLNMPAYYEGWQLALAIIPPKEGGIGG